MRWWHASIVLALPVAAGAQGGAQPAVRDSAVVDRRGRIGLEVWAGVAHTSDELGFLGSAPDLGFKLGALRVTHALHRTATFSVDYAADVVPVAELTRHFVFNGTKLRIVCRQTDACKTVDDDILLKGTAHGVGISPLGLVATFRPTSRVQFGLGGTGGMMRFDQPVPTTGAERLNFTAMAEATVSVVDRHGIGPVLAYRFHHISNGGRSDENPAIASHVLSLGMRWRLGRETSAPGRTD